MTVQTDIRPVPTSHRPAAAGQRYGVPWTVAALAALVLVLIAALLAVVPSTHAPAPTRVVTTQAPNANAREGRVSADQAIQPPNANVREDRVPVTQPNANDRESRVPGDR